MAGAEMSRRHRNKPEWLLDAEWKLYLKRHVAPRIRRRWQRLRHRPNLSVDALFDLYEQATKDAALWLSGMSPEAADKMLATDPRWTKLATIRAETASLAAKLLAREGIMVLQ